MKKKKKSTVNLNLAEEEKVEFGNDPTALKGAVAVEKSNREVYEKATPEQRKLIDSVSAEMAKVNREIEDYFFGEAYTYGGKTYYAASDTSKDVMTILEATGDKSLAHREEIRDSVRNLAKGSLINLADVWYIKRFDGRLQEVTKYVFTLEKMILNKQTVTVTEPVSPKQKPLTFFEHIKEAFRLLLTRKVF